MDRAEIKKAFEGVLFEDTEGVRSVVTKLINALYANRSPYVRRTSVALIMRRSDEMSDVLTYLFRALEYGTLQMPKCEPLAKVAKDR